MLKATETYTTKFKEWQEERAKILETPQGCFIFKFGKIKDYFESVSSDDAVQKLQQKLQQEDGITIGDFSPLKCEALHALALERGADIRYSMYDDEDAKLTSIKGTYKRYLEQCESKVQNIDEFKDRIGEWQK